MVGVLDFGASKSAKDANKISLCMSPEVVGLGCKCRSATTFRVEAYCWVLSRDIKTSC